MKESYPPFAYFTQVLQHCPKAGWTYIKLWNFKDLENKVTLDKKTIREELQTTPTRFKNDLLALSNEGVISVHEHPKSFVIEMTDWEFDCLENTLC